MTYYVYMLKCADNTLYTGITTNLERRLREHNEGKIGAKYTKPRRPVSFVYTKPFPTRSEALKFEHAVKQLSKAEKLKMIYTE